MIKILMTCFVPFLVLPYNIVSAQDPEYDYFPTQYKYTYQELIGDTVISYTKDDFKVLILNNKETLYNNRIKTFFKGEEVRDFPLEDCKYEVRDVRIINNKYFILVYYYERSDIFYTYSWENDHWIGKEYGILGGSYHPRVVPKPEKIEAIDLDKFIVTRAGKKYLLQYDQKAPRFKKISETEIEEEYINGQHAKPDTICSVLEGDLKILIVFDSILQRNQIKTWYQGIADSANTTLHPKTIKCRDLKIFDKHRMIFVFYDGYYIDHLLIRDWTGKTWKGVHSGFIGSAYPTPNRPLKIEILYYNKFTLYYADRKILLEYNFEKGLETRTEVEE